MKRLLVVMAASIWGLGSARAELPTRGYVWTDPSRIGAEYSAPPPDTVSHVIYLNNCQPNGCTLTPGNNDSTNNQSSIVNSTSQISAYAGSASDWAAIVACVKQTYAPFNVQIVDQRPTSGGYHMAIVAGTAQEAGIQQQGVLGVSPFTCGYIPNSISFSFANTPGETTNIDDICWTVSQETAHSWGLDHKLDDKSPMTYLSSGPAMKTFQNTTMSCGEYSARQCNCTYNGSTNGENDYALVLATFGTSAPDTTPPTVMITSPANNAVVMAGFTITANITDDQFVASATLKIDGTAVGQPLTGAPWQWTAPSLGQGSHTIEVDGFDGANNMGSATVSVSIGGGSCSNGSCPSGQTCVQGTCVAGPGTPGGLGSPCTNNADCASQQCASDSTGTKYCVEPCDPTMNGCPSGFGCVSTSGTMGVCWPGADHGGGGCTSTNGDGAIIFALAALAAMLITRKRS